MVRYTIWERDALVTYQRADITPRQRTFTEGILRSLEVGTYLSEHVSGATSVVLALTRAHHALDEHARVNQPKIGLTRTVLSQAFSDVKSGISAYSTTQSGRVMIMQAQRTLDEVNVSITRNLSATTKERFAEQIDALVQPATLEVRALFGAAWTSPDLSTPVTRRIRNEVSVLVALEGRDGMELQSDILRILRRGMIDANAVADVLWPDRKMYRVALVLSGARVLEGLGQLLPGAQQWPLLDSLPSAGIPSWEIQRLLDAVVDDGRRRMLIILPVLAADAYTAMAYARREVAEVLDQYAAGQRLLELIIAGPAMAVLDENVFLMSNPGIAGSREARPLTSHWPAPIRSSLRMANLADRMDAPVASVMLAWSAIESMGIRPSDLEVLAKACALHALRQQILAIYQSVTDSAIARLRFSRWQLAAKRTALAGLERSHAAARRSNTAKANEAATLLEVAVAEGRKDLVLAASNNEQLEQRLLPAIETIRRNLLKGGDPKQPLRLNQWGLPLNDFLDAILPLDAAAGDDVRQTQEAILALASEAGGIAEESLATWRRRLASPVEVADWLIHQQGTFYGILTWMYASRNLAIHSGRFAVPADVLTSQAARGIVDIALEFLGHWYQVINNLGLQESGADAILRELAERKDDLENHLRSASSCRPLNVFTLTAPDGDCWHRVMSDTMPEEA